MKLIKLAPLAALLVATSQASTVSISTGFGGVSVTENGAANDGYALAIGGFEGGVFTQFGMTLIGNLANIQGNFSGSGPISLNGDQVFLYVGAAGTGTDINRDPNAGYAIFQTTGFFPADVSGALNSSIVPVENGGQLTLVEGSPGTAIVGNSANLVVVPEPSVALLGALGVLGLIRRRR